MSSPQTSPPLRLRLAQATARALSRVLGPERARRAVGRGYAIATLLAYGFQARYGRALLGLGWVVLSPLLFLAVYLPLFAQRGLGLDAGAETYVGDGRLAFPIYVALGFLVWVAFSQALRSGAASLASNPGVVQHSPMPLAVLPFVRVLSALVGLAIGLVLVLVLVSALGRWPGLRLLWLPAAFALFALFCHGLALLLSALSVVVRDVLDLLGTLLLIEFFAVPVLYVPSFVSGDAASLVQANPMTPFLTLFRASLIPEYPLVASDLGAALGWTLGAWLIGRWVFRRLERSVADYA